MINILQTFMKLTRTSSDDCSECDTTSVQGSCMECSNDCTSSCSILCSDTDTSGLSAGVCDSAGKGTTESGCLFCISSYSK